MGRVGRSQTGVILPWKESDPIFVFCLFILELELTYLYLKLIYFPRYQRMLQPALSEWWNVCGRCQPVQMHLSSGKDREPLSASGPDWYVAAVGLGEDGLLQREK